MGPEPAKLFGIACIDEAGRGPMIGPMIVCGLLFEEDADSSLRNLGVKDSKLLAPRKREALYDDILSLTSRSSIRTVPASKIDELRSRGITLNEIELRQFISIAKKLRPLQLFVDSVDVDTARFGSAIAERSRLQQEGILIVSEHRADVTYPIVSAASIIAKVQRDRAIYSLHEEFGDFGSGYPSDPKTVSFVRNIIAQGEPLPSIIRRSWESVKRIEAELTAEQTSLDSY